MLQTTAAAAAQPKEHAKAVGIRVVFWFKNLFFCCWIWFDFCFVFVFVLFCFVGCAGFGEQLSVGRAYNTHCCCFGDRCKHVSLLRVYDVARSSYKTCKTKNKNQTNQQVPKRLPRNSSGLSRH